MYYKTVWGWRKVWWSRDKISHELIIKTILGLHETSLYHVPKEKENNFSILKKIESNCVSGEVLGR